VTASDVRRIFSNLIFENDEPVAFISVQNGELLHKSNKNLGGPLHYFPEIEELVEFLSLNDFFFEAMDNSEFRIGSKKGNIDLYLGFSDEDELRRLVDDIKKFASNTEERIEILKPLYPHKFFYVFRSHYSWVEVFLGIGFHEKYIEEYSGKDRTLPEFRYVSYICFNYVKDLGEEVFIRYGSGGIKEGNVAIITQRDITGSKVKLPVSSFLQLVKDVIDKEKGAIKSLWKYLLLS